MVSYCDKDIIITRINAAALHLISQRRVEPEDGNAMLIAVKDGSLIQS